VPRTFHSEWIRAHVATAGEIELVHDRPWARVSRVPAEGGVVWFKECAPIQAFEPRLTAALSERWPGRVAEVLAHDVARRWLLLADAGTALGELGNPPERWLEVLPLYAELQRGEAAFADDHVAHGVTDMRLAVLPERFESYVRTARVPPALAAFAPRFRELCGELAAFGIPASVQHDDLHMANVYADGARTRVLDWGDTSIAHPFASLVVTFRFLEARNRLARSDPWFTRLRDAYLEPWGAGHEEAFALALRVGWFAYLLGQARQGEHMPADALPHFQEGLDQVTAEAMQRIEEPRRT
jgi:hypothetical protein